MNEALAARVALLRDAETALRADWDTPPRLWGKMRDYHLAAADWLAGEAATLAEMEPFVELLNAAIENESGVTGYLRFAEAEDGSILFRSDTSPAAERFARAYLGTEAAE